MKRSNYTVSSTNLGYTVNDKVGSGRIDTLKRILILKFSDATVTVNQATVQLFFAQRVGCARNPEGVESLSGCGCWVVALPIC